MTADEALERIRARWFDRPPPPAVSDVEERAALRLRDALEREVLVHVNPTVTGPVVRLFARLPELDEVSWPNGKRRHPVLKRGWHSGYVHELADVDRVLDGVPARLAEAAAAAAKKAAKKKGREAA